MAKKVNKEWEDFFPALAELEREKGITEEMFFDALKGALTSAYKKQNEGDTGVVRVEYDVEKGNIRFFLEHIVVDSDEPQDGEILLKDAVEI